jgi:hypothetical protein
MMDPLLTVANLPSTKWHRPLIFSLRSYFRPLSGLRCLMLTRHCGCSSRPFRRLKSLFSVNDLVTLILLFAQYSVVPSRATLVLAGGYLYTGLLVVERALTYPGHSPQLVFLVPGLQTTGWLYAFCYPLTILGHAC